MKAVLVVTFDTAGSGGTDVFMLVLAGMTGAYGILRLYYTADRREASSFRRNARSNCDGIPRNNPANSVTLGVGDMACPPYRFSGFEESGESSRLICD